VQIRIGEANAISYGVIGVTGYCAARVYDALQTIHDVVFVGCRFAQSVRSASQVSCGIVDKAREWGGQWSGTVSVGLRFACFAIQAVVLRRRYMSQRIGYAQN